MPQTPECNIYHKAPYWPGHNDEGRRGDGEVKPLERDALHMIARGVSPFGRDFGFAAGTSDGPAWIRTRDQRDAA
jgi:hypothetical protein